MLRARPDLALPAPGDFATLASRASVRTSVQRAVDRLDAFRLRLLEVRVLAGRWDEPLAVAELARWLPSTPVATLRDGLEQLRALCLVWGGDDATHVVSGVIEAIGPYPAGLGRPAESLGPDATRLEDRAIVAALIAECDEAERQVLDRLAVGPPVGRVRDVLADDGATPGQRLVARGLLIPLDMQTVELPREVGLLLRGDQPSGAVEISPPTVRTIVHSPEELDRLGTSAVFELVRLVEALGTEWSDLPSPVLRSGGLGARELRRTSRALQVDETKTTLVAEIGMAAGLIGSTPSADPVFLPTPEFDDWRSAGTAVRWTRLAGAWLAMTRQPSLVGERDDRDRLVTALSPDAERGTIPGLRRSILGTLAEIPAGHAPADRADVLARLTWQAPRRAGVQQRVTESILAEADVIGVTAAGGLTDYGRALLSGSSAATETALEIALPEPVDHFLVQPDLTVVVPGPPAPDLASGLDSAADLESTGGASVYRVTPSSVRRALDSGWSGTDLAHFFAQNSRTPIPQALTYLVNDLARRHGLLRTGAASAYLRCDDEALLNRVLADRAVAGLRLRRLAPTVVVASVPVARILDVLREAGYAPAAESPDGALLSLNQDAPRAPSRPRSSQRTASADIDMAERLSGVVARMRSGDSLRELTRRVAPTASQEIPGVTSATTLGVLRDAIRASRRIWIGYVDNSGAASQQVILPVSLAGGILRGQPPDGGRLASFPLHRITSVSVLGDEPT